MNENKSAPTNAATSAGVTGTFGGRFSHSQNNISAQDRQGLRAVLLEGEPNAQTAAEIASMLGITPREVTRQIEQARLMGEPICAGQAGYFLPTSVEELRRYARAFDRRLRHIKNTRAALEDMIIKASGQTTLEGVD